MRLDKFLANSGVGTRKEVREKIKEKKINVNGKIVADPSFHIDEKCDIISYDNKEISYKPFVYLMLNKPQGVISATEDKNRKTVICLLEDKYRTYSIFPVGRLDIDTEGLLLLTNDGMLAHNLLSPSKHIDKKYYVELRDDVSDEDILKIEKGIELKTGYVTKESKIERITNSKVYITITEGKYHQVKLMFQAIHNNVEFLKRISMGKLKLDENLKQGEYRELNANELKSLVEYK